MIELLHGDYRLLLQPQLGGSVSRFEWRGMPVFRSKTGDHPLETACFPLVPFCNRIRNGRFTWEDRNVVLSRNLGISSHPMHGFGWLAEWDVIESGADHALLEHRCDGHNEWPWAYRALERFTLDAGGLTMQISVENLSTESAPAGIGFHPYFPRDAQTRYLALQTGEWQNCPECLPVELTQADKARDWWNGAPIGTRHVDTTYVGREGDIQIFWPEKNAMLRMMPSSKLPFTTVFSPEGADFFCVEPVSQMTDAVNCGEGDHGLWTLQPGGVLEASVRLEMSDYG